MSIYTPSNPYTADFNASGPDSYTGSYNSSPEEPDEPDNERIALDAINGIVDRDNQRAEDRYGGKSLLGRASQWFNRKGKRRESQSLEEAGKWDKNNKYKKWLLIGAKVLGGFGVAAATVMSGGAGMFLTPLIWSLGVSRGVDGILEAIEEFGWGNRRTKAELGVQQGMDAAIEKLKAGVKDDNLTQDELISLLTELQIEENKVVEAQRKNWKAESVGKLVRAVASTVATIGTAVFAGIPTGHAHFGGAGPYPIDQTGHATFLNMHGHMFAYNNPAEVASIQGFAQQTGGLLSTFTNTYGQISHAVGSGLAVAQQAGLVASAGYLIGNVVRGVVGVRRAKEGFSIDKTVPSDPYLGYSAYSNGVPKVENGYTNNHSQGSSSGGSGSYGQGQSSADSNGYENMSYKSLNQNVQSVSETAKIEADPALQESLRQKESVREHHSVNQYIASQDSDYRDGLSKLGKELADHSAPMSSNCRVAVCIPVAYNEKNITHTLEQFLGQKLGKGGASLPSGTFEINLYVNGPKKERAETDRLIAEIQSFKRKYGKEVKINLVASAWDNTGKKPTMGYLRKFINDLTLVRSQGRPISSGPLTLVSNDADLGGIGEDYISKILGTMDTRPKADVVAGKVDYHKEEYKQYPYLLAVRRLWQFTDISRQKFGRRPKAYGANTFIRASAYAEAGGYDRTAVIAEDLQIANKLTDIHGAEVLQTANVPLYTNPRRDLDAISKGEPIVKAYDYFADNEDVRNNKDVNLEHLTVDNPEFVERLNKDASALFATVWEEYFWPLFDKNPEVRARRAAAAIGNSNEVNLNDLVFRLKKGPLGQQAWNEAMTVFNKALGWWGADCSYRQVEENRAGRNVLSAKLTITNWDLLKKGLDRYKS